MAASPKRHHYLPRAYLERFCRDGLLWLFDRERNEYRAQPPNETGAIRHFYSVEVAGQKRTEIESFLSQIEDWSREPFAKLQAGDVITDDDKYHVGLYVGFMMNRVPDFERSVNNISAHLLEQVLALQYASRERLERTLKEMAAEGHPEAGTWSVDDMMDFYRRGNYSIKFRREHSLRLMLEISEEVGHLFAQMDWVVFHAPARSSFITSDNPVVLWPPYSPDRKGLTYGVGILTEGARKLFPISQTTCLMMLDRGERVRHGDADANIVRTINLNVAARSDRFVIGRDEALVRNLVATTGLPGTKSKPRIQIL